jgi:hypothetical protein
MFSLGRLKKELQTQNLGDYPAIENCWRQVQAKLADDHHPRSKQVETLEAM